MAVVCGGELMKLLRPGMWGDMPVFRVKAFLRDCVQRSKNFQVTKSVGNEGETSTMPNPRGVVATKNVSCQVSNDGVISYFLPKAEVVSLRLHHVNGRLLSEISGKEHNAGSYSIHLPKSATPAGSYVLVFEAGDYVEKQKVFLTK